MKRLRNITILLALAAHILAGTAEGAEQHRATRLGNPATRFAPPLYTAEDLRMRFRDLGLRPDIAEVLRQWRWTGRVEDLFRAAATAEIREVSIPVGSTMPFMSSRENGRPVCLRNVLWAGDAPAPAYAFNFTSNGRRYRCVTPKACSNFFLEDLGPEPVPALALQCNVPGEVPLGRPVRVCLTVSNPGTGVLPRALVRLPIPRGLSAKTATEGGVIGAGEIVWEVASLDAKASRPLCAVFEAAETGTFIFAATAGGANVKTAQSSCSAKVFGISAILIDAIDLEDPVQVGSEVTYEIKVTNQGSSVGTNVRLRFNLPPNQEFVSGGGITEVRARDGEITTDPLPSLAAKGEAVWRVKVKANEAGDVRFKIELTSDQFEKPIHEEESTLLY